LNTLAVFLIIWEFLIKLVWILASNTAAYPSPDTAAYTSPDTAAYPSPDTAAYPSTDTTIFVRLKSWGLISHASS
jgi:hypothetical protein